MILSDLVRRIEFANLGIRGIEIELIDVFSKVAHARHSLEACIERKHRKCTCDETLALIAQAKLDLGFILNGASNEST